MHDRVRGSRLWSERRLSLTWPRSQCRGFLRSLIQITVTLPRRSCRSIGVRPLNFSPGVACQPPGLFSCRPLGDCKPIAINRSLPVSGQMEREHLSMRMASKRLAPFEQRIFKAPFQSAFSKRLGNHAAAVGLDVAHYNLRRAHEALRSTPANGRLASRIMFGRLVNELTLHFRHLHLRYRIGGDSSGSLKAAVLTQAAQFFSVQKLSSRPKRKASAGEPRQCLSTANVSTLRKQNSRRPKTAAEISVSASSSVLGRPNSLEANQSIAEYLPVIQVPLGHPQDTSRSSTGIRICTDFPK